MFLWLEELFVLQWWFANRTEFVNGTGIISRVGFDIKSYLGLLRGGRENNHLIEKEGVVEETHDSVGIILVWGVEKIGGIRVKEEGFCGIC